MFLGQFTGDDCHFTSLIQYQKHQENAPIQFVVNHYTELIESKGKPKDIQSILHLV